MKTCIQCHKKRESTDALCIKCQRKALGLTKTFKIPERKKLNNVVIYSRGFNREYMQRPRIRGGNKWVRSNNWTIH